jgi:L-rhamnose-H+ transport protein
MELVLGVFLLVFAGMGGASFYVPIKYVREWAWESSWLVYSTFAWFVMPVVVAFLTVPDLIMLLRNAPLNSMIICYGLGLLWGFGGITFGLAMRYLGLSLGYAIAMGATAAFGTLLPPLYFGTFGEFILVTSGLVTLSGVIVCLVGIAICGWAGMLKEKVVAESKKKESIKEFNYKVGIWIALVCGIVSALYPLAVALGKPISEYAVAHGTSPFWKVSPVFLFIHAGGCTSNVIYCLILNYRHQTGKDYFKITQTFLVTNFLLSMSAGILWYLQMMIYGIGYTLMGKYDFTSWTLWLGFGIFFSNVWGLVFHEWRGSGRKIVLIITIGLFVIVLSGIVIGYGNYLASLGL